MVSKWIANQGLKTLTGILKQWERSTLKWTLIVQSGWRNLDIGYVMLLPFTAQRFMHKTKKKTVQFLQPWL